MNYLKRALTELLSGLTTKKNEKEIWTTDKDWGPITVEPIDDERYIVRSYRKSGQLCLEYQYKNNQRHGVVKWWDEDGILYCNEIWENGKWIKSIK